MRVSVFMVGIRRGNLNKLNKAYTKLSHVKNWSIKMVISGNAERRLLQFGVRRGE